MKKSLFLALLIVCSLPVFSQKVLRDTNGFFGLATVKKDGSIAWRAKPQYVIIERYKANVFLACNAEGKWGVLNDEGKFIFKCTYPSKVAAREAYDFKVNPSSKTSSGNLASTNSGSSPWPTFTLTRDYGAYIKNYVEGKVNSWQKRGQFETASDFQRRVGDDQRRQAAQRFTTEVCDECIMKSKDKKLVFNIGEYDSSRQAFLITSEIGNFMLPIASNKAKEFSNKWAQYVYDTTFDIVNGKIVLKTAVFTLNNKEVARYENKSNAPLYALAVSNLSFDPLDDTLLAVGGNSHGGYRPVKVVQSDVDTDIPMWSPNANGKTFALIFANENYSNESNVDFAIHDGETLQQYFINTLGIPKDNIQLTTDATKNEMIRQIEWLQSVAKVYNGDINILIYYAGHGVPDEYSKDAYLIPVDGVGSSIRTLYKLSSFYEEIASIPSASTVIFLDACFSGKKRDDNMLADARGVAIKANRERPNGNMVILSAANGDETAWSYEEKGHGLFTYFLLKKLQESKGDVTLKQLSDYVIDEVGRHSIVVNKKSQTPTVIPSSGLEDSWSDIRLR